MTSSASRETRCSGVVCNKQELKTYKQTGYHILCFFFFRGWGALRAGAAGGRALVASLRNPIQSHEIRKTPASCACLPKRRGDLAGMLGNSTGPKSGMLVLSS